MWRHIKERMRLQYDLLTTNIEIMSRKASQCTAKEREER